MPASQPFRLRDLLPEAEFLPGNSEPTASEIHLDPLAAGPGCVYVHLDEFDASGAEIASRLGASAVVSERLLPEISAPLAIVRDAHLAYAKLRDAEEKTHSTASGFVVAGSVGRAVTSNLLSRIAASQQMDSGKVVVAQTPGNDSPVRLTPNVACLTTLRADRLTTDGEPRWESVAEHRAAIRRTLGSLHRDTTLVVNAEDPDSIALASRHGGQIITYGERCGADVVVTELESFPGGQEFLISHRFESAAVTVATPGRAYRTNCAAAIAAGLANGIALESCVHAVEMAPRPYGMLEPVICGQPFPVVLDRATRPLALRSALRAARPAGGGRLYAVVRLSTDPGVAAEQLAATEQLADRVIAESPNLTIERSAVGDSVTIVEDRLAAMAIALGLADEGDSVVIAGSTTDGLAADRVAAEGLLRRRMACIDTAAAA